MLSLSKTLSTAVAATLLSTSLLGCEPTDGAAEADPAVTAQLATIEADLVAVRDELQTRAAAETTLQGRLDALEAEQSAQVDRLRIVDMLAAKDAMRATLLRLAKAIDSGDPSVLPSILPIIADDFVMVAVDFGEGGQQDTLVFEGVQGLVGGFGPIMLEAQANLMPSAILIDMADAEHATATFKFANSVRPPSALGEQVEEKVLLFAAITAEFRFEDDLWKLVHLELVHSLAYPGSVDIEH